MKLNVIAFGSACGLLWGTGLMLLAWWIMLTGGGPDAGVLGQAYLGYSFTGTGSLIGLLWGLVDGAIGGAILAWLYNALSGRIGQ